MHRVRMIRLQLCLQASGGIQESPSNWKLVHLEQINDALQTAQYLERGRSPRKPS